MARYIKRVQRTDRQKDTEHSRALELAVRLQGENEGYTCRVLPDNTVACKFDLLFTRAIMLGCNEAHWQARYCFEDRRLADKRFKELMSENDEPKGYIAKR